MPIESLPSAPINYPIMHFPPVPERRVIPTAAYAAAIARSLAELAKQLSPEEREKHKLELDILRSQADRLRLDNEYQAANLSKFRGHQSNVGSYANHANAILGSSTTLDSGGTNSAPVRVQPLNPPTTDLPDFYGHEFTQSIGDPTQTPNLSSPQSISIGATLPESGVSTAHSDTQLTDVAPDVAPPL
jgi:hypothetical protein